MRLIDAHDLMERVYDANPKGRVELAELIETEPTVDAVEVVRCNNCKYLGILNEKRIYAICNKHGKVFYLWGEDAREHYCSWGERREDVSK